MTAVLGETSGVDISGC